MTTKMPGRNDPRAAVDYYAALLASDGAVSGDTFASLIRLQDDPTDFYALMEQEHPHKKGDVEVASPVSPEILRLLGQG